MSYYNNREGGSGGGRGYFRNRRYANISWSSMGENSGKSANTYEQQQRRYDQRRYDQDAQYQYERSGRHQDQYNRQYHLNDAEADRRKRDEYGDNYRLDRRTGKWSLIFESSRFKNQQMEAAPTRWNQEFNSERLHQHQEKENTPISSAFSRMSVSSENRRGGGYGGYRGNGKGGNGGCGFVGNRSGHEGGSGCGRGSADRDGRFDVGFRGGRGRYRNDFGSERNNAAAGFDMHMTDIPRKPNITSLEPSSPPPANDDEVNVGGGVYLAAKTAAACRTTNNQMNFKCVNKATLAGEVDHIYCVWHAGTPPEALSKSNEEHSSDAENFIRAVGDMLRNSLGVKVRGFTVAVIENQNNEMDLHYQELKTIFTKIAEKDASQSMVIHVDYSENKSHGFLQLMERKFFVMTQQITQEVAVKTPEQRETCKNICLKTYCKLGSLNYEVIPEAFCKNEWLSSGKTLVIGYDVLHPEKPSLAEQIEKKPPQMPSIVGFSFNGGKHPEAFIGDFHYQIPCREQVASELLNVRAKWMLANFIKNRCVWPERVIITRYGVSEGQLRMVMADEITAIKEAFREYGNLNGFEEYCPPITVLIATKRHSTRLLGMDEDSVVNILPATVVDTTIVRPNVTEFYMCSAEAHQGTVEALSYQKIVDENKMSSDEIQSFILALCFTHQISSAPISLPEPIYQAEAWASRGRDMWEAFDARFNLPTMKIYESEVYSQPPIDFEKMTAYLSYMNTPLEGRRINA